MFSEFLLRVLSIFDIIDIIDIVKRNEQTRQDSRVGF